MRLWDSLVIYAQDHPHRFVELIMLALAQACLLIWGKTQQWPYLVLGLSYGIGCSVSILIREGSIARGNITLSQLTAIVLLVASICSFSDLVHYL